MEQPTKNQARVLSFPLLMPKKNVKELIPFPVFRAPSQINQPKGKRERTELLISPDSKVYGKLFHR